MRKIVKTTMMRRRLLILLAIISHSSSFVVFNHRATSLSHQCSFPASVHTENESCSSTGSAPVISIHSKALGDIKKIRIAGENDPSFVAAMDVPTFASFGNMSISSTFHVIKSRGLEGVLRAQAGPSFVLDNVISSEICEELIKTCEALGFGCYQAGKNHHGALQILVSQGTANCVGQALSRHIDISQVAIGSNCLVFAGLNRRWRIYRYSPGGKETFAPHIDAGFPPSGLSEDHSLLVWDDSPPNEEVVSRLTVLMYLNDDFVGGETKFYQPRSELGEDYGQDTPPLIASVRPQAGSVLVFPQAVGEEAMAHARQHWPVHEGAPVLSGSRPKYVIRSDVLFATQPPADVFAEQQKHLFQYDNLVREAFLQQSPAFDRKFMNHLSSLYNPHMGVENIGPFLYSFVRFTKVKQIVEIGAGYTSLWILQALKDNTDEVERIRNLQRDGKCRLLDYPWTVPGVVENYNESPSTLLCIDNCLHQKETATGAAAVAKTLGLDSYMHFIRGDAFELELDENSVDLLWCDFGVGSRMKEFVSRAWPSIRRGGFLLCHSTLTNTRTRDWLEAARARKGKDQTGIPPDEYVEVSLLEPHKRYQNSVTIIQKRKESNGEDFEEPLFSEFA